MSATRRRRNAAAGLTPAMENAIAEMALFAVFLRNGEGVYAPAGALPYVAGDGRKAIEGAIAPATLAALAARGLAEQRFTAHSGHAFYRLTRRGRTRAARLARIERARAKALADRERFARLTAAAPIAPASPRVVEGLGRLAGELATRTP
ncbi:MAG: hypothetical protein ABSF67_02885 [Roseiarcus sp.]|jgi:hypothetical protein